MLKLDFICSYWDNPQGLRRMIKSIPPEIINTLFIRDGKYAGRDDKPEYHQDETKAVLNYFRDNGYKGKIHYVLTKKPETQIEKRNKLWDRVELDKPDYCIVIDSDEYIEVDVDLFKSELLRLYDYPHRCIPIKNKYLGEKYRVPRLFKPPFNFRHKYRSNGMISHGSLFDGEQNVIQDVHKYDELNKPKRGQPEHQNGIDGIMMFHNKDVYSNQRMLNNEMYYTTNPER